MREAVRKGRSLPVLVAVLSLAIGCNGEGSSPADGENAALYGPNRTDSTWVHQNQPKAKVALVLVHGLFGDTIETWRGHSGGFPELIKADAMIGPQVDVFAFGFTSQMFAGGSLSVDEAANSLRMRLENVGVLSYPAVVFVGHSMGGLVALQLLVNESELLERVPAVILYATPQEGADITRIARHIFRNDALEEMLPGAESVFIRQLNDDWKRINEAVRPFVHCAYEKKVTGLPGVSGGIMVVEWGSATRFCSGAALAVDANHIDIVKPDRLAHDSFMLLQNALRPILTGDFLPRLETPDFEYDGDTPVVTIDDPLGREEVRLVNAGALPLAYALRNWPEGLNVWPLPGEHLLRGRATERLQLAPAFGTTKSEYEFLLEWDETEPRQKKVLVRIPDLEQVRAEEAAIAAEVMKEVRAFMSQSAFAAAAEGSPEQAQEQIVEVVRRVVGERYPALISSGQWVRTAEILESLSWPRLAATALRKAEAVDPAISGLPSVVLLGQRTASLAGTSALSAVPAVPLDDLPPFELAFERSAFQLPSSQRDARVVAELMVSTSSLEAEGLSLQGDLAALNGVPDEAIERYREAAALSPAPLHDLQAERMRQGPPG